VSLRTTVLLSRRPWLFGLGWTVVTKHRHGLSVATAQSLSAVCALKRKQKLGFVQYVAVGVVGRADPTD